MKCVTQIDELREILSELKTEDKKIGLVPTMGNIHNGHLSLIDRAREDNCYVVTSIFVNPLQFSENEDFEDYPKTIEHDLLLLREHCCDLVFMPEIREMYRNSISTVVVNSSDKVDKLCGKFRPGHFDGVLTVVLKLFNICNPDNAYFGLKDYQQFLLIKEMVKDFDLNVNVVACPTVRESDGLAMSSRNTYLSYEDRNKAAAIYKAMTEVKNAYREGLRDIKILENIARDIIYPVLDIQYIEILDSGDLSELNKANDNALIAVAAYCGRTRLIDNMIIGD